MTNKNEEKVVEDSIESVMEEQLKKNLKEVTAWIEEENGLYGAEIWILNIHGLHTRLSSGFLVFYKLDYFWVQLWFEK